MYNVHSLHKKVSKKVGHKIRQLNTWRKKAWRWCSWCLDWNLGPATWAVTMLIQPWNQTAGVKSVFTRKIYEDLTSLEGLKAYRALFLLRSTFRFLPTTFPRLALRHERLSFKQINRGFTQTSRGGTGNLGSVRLCRSPWYFCDWSVWSQPIPDFGRANFFKTVATMMLWIINMTGCIRLLCNSTPKAATPFIIW